MSSSVSWWSKVGLLDRISGLLGRSSVPVLNPAQMHGVRIKAMLEHMDMQNARVGAWQRSTFEQPMISEGPGRKMRRPRFNYSSIMHTCRTSWIFAAVADAIIRESLHNRGKVQPAFFRKCSEPECGWLTQSKDLETSSCPACNGVLVSPDMVQNVLAQRLTSQHNGEYGFWEILKSTIWHSLTVDDHFWSIGYAFWKDEETGGYVREAREFYIEDPTNLFIVGDERGRLGGMEYFCQRCESQELHQSLDGGVVPVDSYTVDYIQSNGGEGEAACPKCGWMLKRVCYVQVIGGTVMTRYAEDEIVHEAEFRDLPSLYGYPKPVSIDYQLKTLKAMDRFNYALYSTGKVGQIITMENETVESVREIADNWREVEDRNAVGTYQPKMHSLFMPTAGKVDVIPTMPPLSEMQSLEWYEQYSLAINRVYNVSIRFTMGEEETAKVDVEVDNRATRRQQRDLEESLRKLFLRFGITDWVYIFESPEKEDSYRALQETALNTTMAIQAHQAGFAVSKNHDTGLFEVGDPLTAPGPQQSFDEPVAPKGPDRSGR